jgi:hypothetical protein
MSNGYWSEEELEKVQACADKSAEFSLKYRWLRQVSGVMCILCFAVAAANAHDLSNWMSLTNAVSGWYLYRVYRLDFKMEQLWGEACHHTVKSMTEPLDKADWHARRMHDCAAILGEELYKNKTKEIER